MGKSRIKFNAKAFDAIERKGRADTAARAKRVADACNAQSSWGGYDSAPDRDGDPIARVWSYGRSDTPGSDRALRMVRNLDAGR